MRSPSCRTGRVLIRRSKTDQVGEGNTAYLARGTVAAATGLAEAAYIREGAGFRRLVGRSAIGGRLGVDRVAEICKRVAGFVGMEKKELEGISEHSARVGPRRIRLP